jgi:hypothetical protein
MGMRILLLSISFRALGTWFSMFQPKLKFDAIAVRIEHVLSRRRCDVGRLTVLVEGGVRRVGQDSQWMVELVLVAARYH